MRRNVNLLEPFILILLRTYFRFKVSRYKNAKKIHTRQFKCCPYGNKRTQNTSHRILTSPAIIQHKKDKLATKQRVEEEKLRKRTEREEKKKAREQDKAKKSIKGRGPQPKGKK